MRRIAGMDNKQEEESSIDLTPMLDVVFIMLIFFIVTASFIKESGLEVNRPDASQAQKQEKKNIVVRIGSKGDIWINRRRIDVRNVQANIERLHAESPGGAVVIQADEASTNDKLVVVMDAARAAGVYNVSIAAQ
jgi:biopolymer transport protein ExbD